MDWKNMELVLEILEKDRRIYDIFKDCPYHVLKNTKLKKYAPGEFLLEQDEFYDKFYIVVEGEVDIFVISDFGKKYFLASYGKGNFIGELELFDKRAYMSQVIGQGAVTTLEIDRDSFLSWLEKDHNFSHYVLKTLCNHTYVSMQKMGKNTLYTLKQRICQFFIEEYAKKGQKPFVINVEALGERLGVTGRSVSRIIKDLKDKGILEINNSKVVIVDYEQLLKENKEN